MYPAFTNIVYGPFHTAYHREAVDEKFREALAAYLEKHLLPQVDEPYDSTEGSLVASFNEDKYCGPNSLVKDAYRLEFAFVRASGRDTIKADLLWERGSGSFRPRYRGKELVLSTARRRAATDAFMREVRKLVDEILAGGSPDLTCPSCGLPMSLVNRPGLFDLSCRSGCVAYNFHRDPETGQAMHGHVFVHPRLGEAGATEWD